MRGTLWETCEFLPACEHARRRTNRSFLLRGGQTHPSAGNEVWCRSTWIACSRKSIQPASKHVPRRRLPWEPTLRGYFPRNDKGRPSFRPTHPKSWTASRKLAPSLGGADRIDHIALASASPWSSCRVAAG